MCGPRWTGATGLSGRGGEMGLPGPFFFQLVGERMESENENENREHTAHILIEDHVSTAGENLGENELAVTVQ